MFNVIDVLKLQISSVGEWLASPAGDTVPQPPVAEMIGYLRDVVARRVEPEGNAVAAGSAQTVGANLVEQGVCPQEVVDFAAEMQHSRRDKEKIGEILVDMGAATPKQVSQALRPQVSVWMRVAMRW